MVDITTTVLLALEIEYLNLVPEKEKVLTEVISFFTYSPTEVTPIARVGPTWILELFHGPTFAFKDVALQFLGNLFEYILSTKKGPEARITILGATSGDTGRDV